MTSARLRGPLRSIAQATAIAVVLCFGLPALLSQFVQFLAVSTAAATSERDFTEDDVNAAVKKVIDERSQDGVFVFRDPKLNADLYLSTSRSRSCAAWKAMDGSQTPSFTTRMKPRSNTPSTSGSSQTENTSN